MDLCDNPACTRCNDARGDRCEDTLPIDGGVIQCDLPSDHRGKRHSNASHLTRWESTAERLDREQATAGSIIVKVRLDTTAFDAALERVKAALADLAATPIRIALR